MEMGWTLVLGLFFGVVGVWLIYELVLRQQWWFYHVSRIMRDIRDKLDK